MTQSILVCSSANTLSTATILPERNCCQRALDWLCQQISSIWEWVKACFCTSSTDNTASTASLLITTTPTASAPAITPPVERPQTSAELFTPEQLAELDALMRPRPGLPIMDFYLFDREEREQGIARLREEVDAKVRGRGVREGLTEALYDHMVACAREFNEPRVGCCIYESGRCSICVAGRPISMPAGWREGTRDHVEHPLYISKMWFPPRQGHDMERPPFPHFEFRNGEDPIQRLTRNARLRAALTNNSYVTAEQLNTMMAAESRIFGVVWCTVDHGIILYVSGHPIGTETGGWRRTWCYDSEQGERCLFSSRRLYYPPPPASATMVRFSPNAGHSFIFNPDEDPESAKARVRTIFSDEDRYVDGIGVEDLYQKMATVHDRLVALGQPSEVGCRNTQDGIFIVIAGEPAYYDEGWQVRNSGNMSYLYLSKPWNPPHTPDWLS